MQPLRRTDSVLSVCWKPIRLLLALAAAAALSACAAERPLPKCEGQVRILNPGKWSSSENDLKSACLPGHATFAALDLGEHS